MLIYRELVSWTVSRPRPSHYVCVLTFKPNQRCSAYTPVDSLEITSEDIALLSNCFSLA